MSRCDRKNNVSLIVLMLQIVLLCSVLISNICTPIFAYTKDFDSELIVMMYHNIVSNKSNPSKYEIRAMDLEKDIKYMIDKGISIVSPRDIYRYKNGEGKLPKKACLLTFDDGYYSYIRYLLPLLSKYNATAIVNVVGEYTAYNKNNPKTAPKYRYLDYEDMGVLQSSGRIYFGLHSYKMHHIKGGVQGVGQRKGESDADYRLRLLADTNRLISALQKNGIKSDIYAYPYGAYSRCSDRILSEVGIKMTLSCNEGINYMRPNSSLYLLKRYNRDGNARSLREVSKFFA